MKRKQQSTAKITPKNAAEYAQKNRKTVGKKGLAVYARSKFSAQPILIHPIAIGKNRPKIPGRIHGAKLPKELIAKALCENCGVLWMTLAYIRANGYPDYRMMVLKERISQSEELQEIMELSRMEICGDALRKLREAVARGEEWAVKQVLNAPLSTQFELGQPSTKVAIDARSVSVGVLDPIDAAQRLARLDSALTAIQGGQIPAALPPVPAPVSGADDAASAPILPAEKEPLPTSHNPDYVSSKRKRRSWFDQSEDAEEVEDAPPPPPPPRPAPPPGKPFAIIPRRGRGRPPGSRDSKPRKKRPTATGGGNFEATGGGP